MRTPNELSGEPERESVVRSRPRRLVSTMLRYATCIRFDCNTKQNLGNEEKPGKRVYSWQSENGEFDKHTLKKCKILNK